MTISNKDKVLFQNSKMYKLMNELEIHNDYINNIKNKSIQKLGKDYVIANDEKAVLFRFSNVQDEITAYDITEEYILQNKLKEQNEAINENNKNLIWTIEHIEDVEKEEKSLKMKNRFHDLFRAKYVSFTGIFKPRS